MHVWSKLSAAKWVDSWEERFNGNPNLVISYLKGGKSIRMQLYCNTEEEALTVKEQWGGSIRKMADSDWNIPVPPPRPVKVRDVFLLTAESDPDKLAEIQRQHPKRDIITIPPEMAFGTGDHATTSTCLRILVDVARDREGSTWTMADLGTGSGVLAIAAEKLGSAETFACDFDPFSVEAATRNALRNHTPHMTVEEHDVLKWEPRQQGYDVVMANLFSTVLIEAWPVIAKTLAPGGTLIVSGILSTQAWDVFTAAAGEGLGFYKVVKKGKWVTACGGHMDDLT